ncbi:MAG TPA: hypothetical protein VL915_04545 [Gemmatimonadales bacterium]|nr:hypothetical protein [Gemmatimonadales bacterium]
MTVAVLALMAGVAVFSTSAAFTATSSNPGNRIEAGTVAIGDSDAGTGALYNALNQKPGSGNGPTAACIRVTYSGSLASAVKLYSSAISNGSQFRLKVERGSGLTGPAADMNCAGFTSSSTPFDALLSTFPTTYAGGIDGKAAAAAWSSGDSVDYRFTIYTVDDTTPNAHTSAMDTGTHSFTWEAQNN